MCDAGFIRDSDGGSLLPPFPWQSNSSAAAARPRRRVLSAAAAARPSPLLSPFAISRLSLSLSLRDGLYRRNVKTRGGRAVIAWGRRRPRHSALSLARGARWAARARARTHIRDIRAPSSSSRVPTRWMLTRGRQTDRRRRTDRQTEIH